MLTLPRRTRSRESSSCPATRTAGETAAHLIAALPQAHDVIVFSTRPGEGNRRLP